ncbi:MAG: hypothetical protein ACXAAH_00990 [Promethearchaeota archaeon]|jgi:hypothetical protein
MIVAEYGLKKTIRIMKKDNKQEVDKDETENEVSFYDIMLEAIKFGLLPRSS